MNIFGCVVKESAVGVVICSNEQQVGRVTADRVLRWVEGLTTPVLGLATGSSPLAFYGKLACRMEEGEIDFSCGISFALDEHMGIDPEDPLSYRQTILRMVAEPLCMDPTRVCVSNNSASDLAAAALEYDQAIAAVGGADVQVLGIDSSGHIGLGEPTSSFASRTHAKALTEQTRTDDARFFGEGERVPTHCVTRGLGTIIEVKHAVMVVTRRHKARTVTVMVEGPVATTCPTSILQFHPSVPVVVDEATITGLNYADYFCHVVDILA